MPYRRVAGVRLRPVPELGTCLAFTPSSPKLHTLNPAAWLIAELCGAAGAELEQDFVRSLPSVSREEAMRQLAEGIRQLLDSRIVEWAEDIGRNLTEAAVTGEEG